MVHELGVKKIVLCILHDAEQDLNPSIAPVQVSGTG